MRAFMIILTAAAIGSNCSGNRFTRFRTGTDHDPKCRCSRYLYFHSPLTFTTTNCMMSCNSRAANCQAGCFPSPRRLLGACYIFFF